MALKAAGAVGHKECLHHRGIEGIGRVGGVRKGGEERHRIGTDAKGVGGGVCQNYDI